MTKLSPWQIAGKVAFIFFLMCYIAVSCIALSKGFASFPDWLVKMLFAAAVFRIAVDTWHRIFSLITKLRKPTEGPFGRVEPLDSNWSNK